MRSITYEAPEPTLGSATVTPVRLLLLALVVIGSLPLAGSGLPSGVVAVAAAADVCCSAEPETAVPRSEHALALPSRPLELTAASAPFTGEHVRLPFRPPIAS